MHIERTLNRFFASTTPARPVAVFRMSIGLAALGKGLAAVLVFYQLAHDPRSIRAHLFSWVPVLDRTWEILLYGGVWIAAAVGLIAGWRARACAAVLLACHVLMFADQNLWSNHGYLLTLLMLLLCFTDSDAALSVRWRREGRPEREILRWPVLLLKLQLSIVYFYTALAKVNLEFLRGDVIAAVAYVPTVLRRPSMLMALGVTTVAIEFFLCVALWVRPMKHWAFFLGLLLHGLIALLMGPALWVFSLMVLSLYVLFLTERPQSRLVIWDDRCGFCSGWVRLARRLDVLRIHRFEGSSNPSALAEAGVSQEEAAEEIKLRDGRRTYGGFDAVRTLLEETPVGFLWARALALPPIRQAGARVYRSVARRRLCGMTPTASVR